MNIEKLLEKRDEIYGACAMWIILFHVFRKIGMPYLPVLTNVISIGNAAVDIFLFFSGASLAISANKNNYAENGWGEYYGRRFNRVIIPYILIAVPFYLWSGIFEQTGSFLRRMIIVIANISSANFWLRGVQTTWFVFVFLLFYLMFPFLYQTIAKKESCRNGFLVLLSCIIAIITAYIPILKNSTIVWARLPVFMIGILVGVRGQNAAYNSPSRRYLLMGVEFCLAIAIGSFVSTIEIFKTIRLQQKYKWLLYTPMVLALLSILSVFPLKIRKSKFLAKIGKLSLELYLIHITLLHPFEHYGLLSLFGYWTYIILPLSSIVLAMMTGKVEKYILSRIRERKIEGIFNI